MEPTFFPLLAIDIVDSTQGEPSSVLTVVFCVAKKSNSELRQEGSSKIKGEKAAGFSSPCLELPWDSSSFQGPISRR